MSLRRVLLVAVLAFAATSSLWGVRRDLPYAPDSDEVRFLLTATRMATSADPNPHWFGHPGTTFLYAYAAALRVAHAIAAGGPWLGADAGLPGFVELHRGTAVLVGRLVSVGFGILGLWMIALTGERSFGRPVGLIGAWLAALSPLTLERVSMARTDGTGLFFGFLALWALLRLLERPSVRAQLLAGSTLGLAVATRYFLAGLVPLLVAVEAMLLLRARRAGEGVAGATPAAAAAGLGSVPLGLVAGSPFLLLEVPRVLHDLGHEMRAVHPGADGLGFAGNLSWYLGSAIPEAVPPVVLALAAVGAALALAKREPAPLLLLGFALIFLGGISFATLHWRRWLIQILPIFALLAAAALVVLVRGGLARLGVGPRAAVWALPLAVAAASAAPARSYLATARLLAAPATGERAREWLVEHLSPDLRIAAEHYSASLEHTPLASSADYAFSWAEAAGSPEELRRLGYDVVVVSSDVYLRFFAHPRRYSKLIAFYRGLFRRADLLAEFRPGPYARGPVIRVYRLPGPGPARRGAGYQGRSRG